MDTSSRRWSNRDNLRKLANSVLLSTVWRRHLTAECRGTSSSVWSPSPSSPSSFSALAVCGGQRRMGSLCRHVPNDGALTSLLTLCTCSKDVAYWLQRLWPAACVGDCVPLNSLPPRNPGVVDRGSRGAAFASRQGTEVSDGSSLLSQCTALHGVVVPPIPGEVLLMLDSTA